MRKGEIAKIRIKKKHGFGRPLRVETLNFPDGYKEEGDKRNRLLKETIIYEVELIDFEVRFDIDANGMLLKHILEPAEKHEWEMPTD